MLENYKQRIFDLAWRWRVNLLTDAERLELETWFRSLEGTSLGFPQETSVDALEKRLHQLFSNNTKPGPPDGEEEPPNPLG